MFWDQDRSDDTGFEDQRARRQVPRVEHIIGGRVPRERFDRFLGDWNRILDRRVATVIEVYAEVNGVCGLVLAGSTGRGQQWPLSDIDVIPIYENDRVDDARAEAERLRLELIERWLPEGWWTGVDVGRLYFTQGELAQALPIDDVRMSALLTDDRWYHSLDKGYGGKPVSDPHDLAARLVDTFNTYRFARVTVSERLRRAHQEVEAARRELAVEIERQHLFEATRTLRTVVKWLRTWQLERWGESDSSLGRVGTRFERLAHARECDALVHELRFIDGLGDELVEVRMAAAPAWVHERHDRSWRARRLVGEDLSQLDDARDVLRVSSQHEMKTGMQQLYPLWLGIPSDVAHVQHQAAQLDQICTRRFPMPA